jgi:salicylate hydroxylase
MASIGPEVLQAYFQKATNMGEQEEEMATEVILAQGPHMGRKVAEMGRARGRKTVSRADLLADLLELVPKDCISFGKKLVRLNETDDGAGVVLDFSDGTDAEAHCVLGADGIHSLVRQYVLGPQHPAALPKNYDKWQVYRTLVSVDEATKNIPEKWTRNVPILLGPRGHINCIPLNKGTRLSAGVAVRGAALGSGSQTRQLDPKLYEDYSEEAQQIVRLVLRDTSASWSVGDHDHAPTYVRGCVAIVGDAAHASLPFAGNGAAQALEDAAVLYHVLKAVGLRKEVVHEVLLAYDATRRTRSQDVVDLARKFGRIYAYAWEGLHEDPEKMKAFFSEAARFTNDFDVEKQNADAVELFRKLAGVRGCYGA